MYGGWTAMPGGDWVFLSGARCGGALYIILARATARAPSLTAALFARHGSRLGAGHSLRGVHASALAPGQRFGAASVQFPF